MSETIIRTENLGRDLRAVADGRFRGNRAPAA